MEEEKTYNEGRLSERFYNAIENSRDEWIMDSNSEDMQKTREVAETQASIILDGATDLMSGKFVGRMRSLFKIMFSENTSEQMDEIRDTAWQVIDEKIGERVVVMQKIAEDRLLRLSAAAVDITPDGPIPECLKRISWCYLFGFDEPCVILCRSVLEAAFQQAVSHELCKKHPLPRGDGKKPEPNFGLANRIYAAKQELGILPKELCEFAKSIKDRANDLIHLSRCATRDLSEGEALKLLVGTITIIQSLDGKSN